MSPIPSTTLYNCMSRRADAPSIHLCLCFRGRLRVLTVDILLSKEIRCSSFFGRCKGPISISLQALEPCGWIVKLAELVIAKSPLLLAEASICEMSEYEAKVFWLAVDQTHAISPNNGLVFPSKGHPVRSPLAQHIIPIIFW